MNDSRRETADRSPPLTMPSLPQPHHIRESVPSGHTTRTGYLGAPTGPAHNWAVSATSPLTTSPLTPSQPGDSEYRFVVDWAI